MATGGEVGGKPGNTLGSEDLENLKCQPCQEDTARHTMATGGEVGGTVGDTLGSEDLDNLKCQPCQEDTARHTMATGGEVGGKVGDTLGSEDLENLKCRPCQEDTARHTMAAGGEVGGKVGDTLGSEDLDNLNCQPCQEDGELLEAVGLCTDCQEYLCQRCFDGHKIPKVTRGHQLLDKQQMLESQIQLGRKDRCTERCPQHDDEFIKYYCQIHDQLRCSVCLNLNHQTCKGVLYIPDVAGDFANNAEYKQVEDQLSTLLARSKKVATAVEQQSTAFDDSYTRAIKMMGDFRQEMNDAVDKIQAELRREAAEMKSTETKHIGIVTEKCGKAVKELQSKMTKIEAFRKSKQHCNLFTEMMKMKNKLSSLDDQLKEIETWQSVNKCSIQFAPNYDTLDTLKQSKSFGRLSDTDRKEQVGEVTGRNVMADTRTVVKAEYAYDINVKTAHDKENCCISGSAILSNNKLIVCDYNNNNIKVVDVKQGRVTAQLKLSTHPWDIVAIDENTAAATLPSDHKVLFVTIGAGMTVDRDLPVGGQCLGIDYKDGKLAVSFTFPGQVKVMDLKGMVLHTITADKAGREVLNSPLYLAFSPAGTSLYVSNCFNHNVVCLNMDGTVTVSYKETALHYPGKVVTDRRGNIYVCGQGTNNVHQLTPDCKKIRVLLTEADGLQEPFVVSYSETENTLFVGAEDCNVVKVYKTILG